MTALHDQILDKISKATSKQPVNARDVLTAIGCGQVAFDTALATLKHQGRINSAEVTRPALGSFPMLMIWPTGVMLKQPWSGNRMTGHFVPHPPMREHLITAHAPRVRHRSVQACRVCGCTWDKACPGGCYWVEPDLCSACVQEQPDTDQEIVNMETKPRRAAGELRKDMTELLNRIPMTARELADTLGVLQQTTFPALKKMEASGLVKKNADGLWSLVTDSPVCDDVPDAESTPECAEDVHDDDIGESPGGIHDIPNVELPARVAALMYDVLRAAMPGRCLDDVVASLVSDCHGASLANGWWNDRETGADMTCRYAGEYLPHGPVAEKLLLIHTEISEATEGYRTSAASRKIPDFWALEAELADALIRICDLAGGLDLDLGGAVAAKLEHNRLRADHKPENRAQPGGKHF